MRKYVIVVSKDTKKLFLLIWKKFEENFSLFKNVVISNTDDEIRLEFEIQDKKNNGTKNLVCSWIADCLVVYYKSNYFENNLIIPEGVAVPFRLICKTLAIFDKVSDISYTLEKLELGKEINLNSFYAFRLSELRLRWQEVCDLFRYNLPELVRTGAFGDLVRYLLSVSEPSIETVFLSYEGSCYYIKNKQGDTLLGPLPNSKEGRENLILELITLSPSNIVFNKASMENHIGKEIKYLFEDKVIYCT